MKSANAKILPRQAFMGHAKAATTFDVYGHLFDVRERVDAYLAAATAIVA